MDIFLDSSEIRNETTNRIRKFINGKISNASSKGEFSVVYNEHPYEILESLGIIQELKDKGYSIHAIFHHLLPEFHRTFITW